MTTALIVGAGFAGAVTARILAEHGVEVHVIDRRDHIAGNAFDTVTEAGTRLHRYGPHLFHTSMKPVVDWLARFGAFVPYQHRVEAQLPDGRCAPLPVNRTTINLVFGTAFADAAAVAAFLATQAIACPAPRNAAEYLHSRVGIRLTDLFFRPYTKKMWDLDLEDLDAAVTKRIPLRHDDEDRYFPGDLFQILPAHGYTALFANILDHDRITVALATPFHASLAAGCDVCFNSMPIDEYFSECLGPLPYRSIRFHHRDVPAGYALGTAAVINTTDAGPLTRQTDWSRLPGHGGPGPDKTLTTEEPCDYRDNALERYYPVKTSDGRNDALYRRYRDLAAQDGADGAPRMIFIGRCGTYQYLDMHQVINQSLMGARAWLAGAGIG